MGLRLALQPPWVRFLVWAPIAAVLFGGGTRLMSRSIWSTVIVAIVFGVFLAASFTYGTQRMYTALTEAVGGLDQAERSQAIAAVTHGVVPADQKVRSAAVRLGWAYLGGKSADQLKRQERRNWIASAVLVAAGIALAIMDSDQHLYFLVLVLILLVVLPLGVLRTRRIQRNVALLGEDPISR